MYRSGAKTGRGTTRRKRYPIHRAPAVGNGELGVEAVLAVPAHTVARRGATDTGTPTTAAAMSVCGWYGHRKCSWRVFYLRPTEICQRRIAGGGFEPPTFAKRWLVSPTSYRAATPRDMSDNLLPQPKSIERCLFRVLGADPAHQPDALDVADR